MGASYRHNAEGVEGIAKTNSVWSSAPNLTRAAHKNKASALVIIAWCALVVFASPHLFINFAQYIAMTIIIIMAVSRVFAVGFTIYKAVFWKNPNPRPTLPALKNWPRFIVLVPLFKEARIVKTLMQSLEKLDYPQDKLDIFLVCEMDDRTTWSEVNKYMRPPFRLFKVGPSQPRTKPKALNSALASIPKAQADDIITIYDAEDRPHPNQLKAAAFALTSDPNLAAVQAPLGFYNDRKNLLTRFFALEYAALFHVWNPALSHLHLPYTLGGTSNHIRRHIVESAGGWDSYNVTEDADLSFKITAMNKHGQPLKIGCIEYGTQEEAVSTYKAWIHQRSRWLKGFMQTWAVHMRSKKTNPAGGHFATKARMKNALSLQITVGATLLSAFLHVPSLIFLGALFLAGALNLVDFTIPPSFFAIMAFGYGASILTGVTGAVKAGKPYLVFIAPFMPFYWLLQFPAALIAAWEFVTAPSYWRKTEHGPQPNNISHAQHLPDLERPRQRLI